MRKINTPDGNWVPGDPTTNTKGTLIRHWFLQMLQDELCALVTAAGLSLDPSDPAVEPPDNTQVLQAVQVLIEAVSPGAASEATAGVMAIATAAEAQAGVDDARALTPVKLAAAHQGSNQSLSPNGYQRFPGGLILQWGTVAGSEDVWGTRNFNIAFPNAALTIVASGSAGSFATDTDIQARVISATQFQVQNNAYGSGTINWIAIGH